MSARVFITGASGLLGRSVFRTFSSEELSGIKWTCMGLCFRSTSELLVQCDLNDHEKVKRLLEEFRVKRAF